MDESSPAADRINAALAGRYRIERELGRGGMATVYLAQDLKHDRRVAVKVLKPELAAVLGAERFVQEIKTTAALSHPHILPLFDSGRAEGRRGGEAEAFLYYVMPYVEGETLRDKLNRETQLGVDEAVRIATEVADALDYAHRHGVIHRDIKPENILLHDGRPMVADFGIALALSAAAGGRMTETGLSLGTPHYMSPEQATADKEITGRSDIYSLASVLYEMLAGQPPHLGGSAQQIIMKIVTDQARPLTELRKSVPPAVAGAVARALEKLPADRFATAREFADALLGRGPATTLSQAAGHPAPLRPATLARHPLVLGLAAALVAALGLAGTQWSAARRAPPPPVIRFEIDMPAAMPTGNTGNGSRITISPDGRTVAYASARGSGLGSLFVRRLDEVESRAIPGTEAARQPTFSPDGQWIAYLLNSIVWKVPVAGGTPIQVGATLAQPIGLSWSRSGVIASGTPLGIVALPAGGGEGRVVIPIDSAAGDQYYNQLRVLPDGETVLFAIQPPGGIARSRLAVGSLTTGRVTRYDLNMLDPLGVVDGSLVYVAPSGALMAVGIDLQAGQLTGDPVALGPIVATDIGGSSDAALAPAGTLIYLAPTRDAVLGWAEAGDRFETLLPDPATYAYPRLSPDGSRIAVTIGGFVRSDVWIWDRASATSTRLTSTGTSNERPEWSPDGRRVLYRSDRGARSAIWWQPVDLSAPAEPILASDVHDYYEGVLSPDGKALVYQLDDAGLSQSDVLFTRLDGDTATRPISADRFAEAQARVSPDGRWVVFVTDASGTSEVVVQPFPGPGGRIQISSGGGSEPVWSRDGRRIFYRDGRHLMAASVTTSPGFAVTARTPLFPDTYEFAVAPHANYDVSPDGRRFLMVKAASVPELQVVYGWLTELRERMAPAARAQGR